MFHTINLPALIKKYSAIMNNITAHDCLILTNHGPDLGKLLTMPLKVPTKIKEAPTPYENTNKRLAP